MRYMGGKNRLAKRIADIIEPDVRRYGRYTEPFCGSCAVGVELVRRGAAKAESCLFNDADADLIALLTYASDGWLPTTRIDSARYHRIKESPEDYHPAEVGFAKFAMSFGGKAWGGFAHCRRGDDYYGAGVRSLLKYRLLERAAFTCDDFRTAFRPEHAVAYCDPPYTDTTGYKMPIVPLKAIAQYVESDRSSIHYVSEYTAEVPESWRIAALLPVKKCLSAAGNSGDGIERLYVIA